MKTLSFSTMGPSQEMFDQNKAFFEKRALEVNLSFLVFRSFYFTEMFQSQMKLH